MNAAEALAVPSERPSSVRIPEQIKKVRVILIKPTSYTDDGFPQRFARGVLPSNSLAAVYSLTKAAFEDLQLDIPVEIYGLEDGIKSHANKLRRLYWNSSAKDTLLIVAFVAVQTAQFPRACDLIRRWQRKGAICVIGGFHVSGSIATMLDGVTDPKLAGIPCPKVMPAEIQGLMDKGVVVFHGEAEDKWSGALRDILEGKQQLLYRGGQPDLHAAPLPVFPEGYFDKSFVTSFGTVDSSRGCPYTCSFCTVIIVQGRLSRYRDPDRIVEMFRTQAQINQGKVFYFVTDDNFGRNPRWKKILKGLIEVRREGANSSFMIEADLDCDRKNPDFIPLLAEAGCTQVFMGVESLNPLNLADASKWQNNVSVFKSLFQKFHEHGIQVHAGYIVGFPHDTPASVLQNVQELFELGVDQVSFFIYTLLPGSEDHARAVAAGVRIDPDFNVCDSFHVNTDHPTMTREEWYQTYQAAWRQFYSIKNMVAAVKRCKTRVGRMNLLRNYAWYRWSFMTEETHPMIAGFYRYRDYDDRRPGSPDLDFGSYVVQEVFRHLRYVRRFIAEGFILQQVVFEADYGQLIADKRQELSSRVRGIGDWARRTFGRVMSREWLNNFWEEYGRAKWQLLWKPHWHLKMLPHAFSEAVYAIRFALKIQSLIKNTTTE